MPTLDEAIERLKARVEYGRTNYPQMDTTDVKLGIEALKLEKWRRGNMPSPLHLRLPGETKKSNSPGLPLGGIVIKTEK